MGFKRKPEEEQPLINWLFNENYRCECCPAVLYEYYNKSNTEDLSGHLEAR
jgi:hypothetical protein